MAAMFCSVLLMFKWGAVLQMFFSSCTVCRLGYNTQQETLGGIRFGGVQCRFNVDDAINSGCFLLVSL